VEVDALGAQDAGQGGDQVGLVAGKDAGVLLQDGGPDAQAGERLCHLDGDRAAADHHHASGRPLDLEEVLTGQEAGFLEAVDLGRQRTTTRAQQDEPGLEASVLADDLYRVGPGDACLSGDDLDAHGLVASGIVVGGRHLLLDGPDPLPDE